MRLTRRKVLSIGAAAVAAAAIRPVRAADKIQWDLSTVWPESNFHTQNARRFAEEVAKATGGAVEITVKSGGQLGFKGPEHLRAVRDGLVPVADVLDIQQIGDEPILGVESIPFLVGSPEQLKVLHKYMRPIYNQVAQRNNQKILYIVPWPTQYLHLNVKTDNLDGLKGIKIRVPDKNAQDMLAAIGMSPILIPWGETIPALASGAVSGVSTSATSGVDGKFWEFLKYIYPTNHVWSCQMMDVNLDAWGKLTPAQQKTITDIAAKLEPEFWAVSAQNDKDSLKTLTDNGMQVVPVPSAMMQAMREKTAPLLEAFLKRVPEAEKPVRAYLADVKA
ncbi:MAG TPA: TRAP transporter substrate-binding protein [Stellaceae bacterium]|nr:TRAP transporter substrate-binding protein [Stellaceae bacterium]